MMKKIKEFFRKINKKIQEKSLTPAGNRKKVGVILFYASIAVFVLISLRFVYIITVGKVGSQSLDSERQKIYQGSSVIKANVEPFSIVMGCHLLKMLLLIRYTQNLTKTIKGLITWSFLCMIKIMIKLLIF